MVLKHKEITFHINNYAYTVDIGPDIDDEVENGLKRFLEFNKDITTQELLLAYLRKTQELINFKKGIENQVQDLINFKDKKITS
jgi:hypothetical protein